MALSKENTKNPIRGYVEPNKQQRKDCQAVIAMLTFADLGRGAGTLHTSGTARLDLQGTTKTEINLQVQIGSATTAAALVAKTLLSTQDPQNQAGVSNGAISVLNQSLDTATIWKLSGSLP